MLPPPPIRGIYRTDQRARAAYSEGAGIYRILPRAVCLPADLDDLRLAVCWAADHRVPLVPRGAGSAMGGGNVGDGVVVDLTRMARRRLEIDAPKQRAVTSAGVTLAELNTAAGRQGLRLPPDPSSGRWATLGGMLSTNAAGARTVRYGSVRRWVESAELVTADGEVTELRRGQPPAGRTLAVDRFETEAAPAIRAGAELVRARFPRTRKNASGYALDAWLETGDLLDLVIGAEGTLGIVTSAVWRLDPVPAARAGLRVSLRTLDVLADAVESLLVHQPSAVELLDRTFLELVGEAGPEAVLLVEVERDDPASAREAVERAAAAVAPWAASVDPGFTESVASLLQAVTDTLVRLGGTPSGEHGDGRLRAGLLARVYGDEVVALFARA